MFAVLLASALVSAAPPNALQQRRSEAPSPARRESLARGFGLGLAMGPLFHLGDGPVGIKGGVRFSYELAPLSQGLSVAVTLPITVSGSRDESDISTIDRIGVELLPGARISYELLKRLRVYLDLGLGAVIYRYNVEFLGNRTGSAAGFGFRFGLGAEFAVLEKLNLFVEPMQVLLQAVPNVVYRAGGETIVSDRTMPPHWGILIGVHYRL